MDDAGYIAITRQSGLMKELRTIAQNVANASTVGYRREGVVFSEFVEAGGEKSMSMARAGAHFVDDTQGVLKRTGGTLDMAIEGDGFFLIETPQGERLTRAGNFVLNDEGEVVTPLGMRLLSADGAAITLPADGGTVAIASDGELSVDGETISRIGLVTADPRSLRREGDNLFRAAEGTRPVEDVRVAQGFLENANVNPVTEIARLIEVQRAYEMGQNLLQREHDRLTSAIQTLGRSV
jgi:flagellar basal-body rod protein FlgF